MKKTAILTSLITALIFGSTVPVLASDPPGALPPILITEVQPGTLASASEEFIELHNTTDHAIDLATFGWRLEIASTTATSWSSPLRTIQLTGTLEAGQSYLIASQFTTSDQQTKYLADQADLWFAAGISPNSGHVRLLYVTNQMRDGVCTAADTVVDQVEWSTTQAALLSNPSLDGRAVFLSSTSAGINKAHSLQRMLRLDGDFTDVGNDSVDFIAASNTIGSATASFMSLALANEPAVPLPAHNCGNEPPVEEPVDPEVPPEEEPPVDPPVQPPEEVPEVPQPPLINAGLLAPQITELLPNPASPQTDAADEFVEFYNPNPADFDLTGYVLQTGLTATYRYTFPAGSLLPAQGYTTFLSMQTKASLSNSGGKAQLLDPSGAVIAESSIYGSAKDGQAWALQSGEWRWVTSPTPGAINSAPAVQPVIKAAAAPKSKKTTTKKPAAAKITKPKTKAAKAEKSKSTTIQKTASANEKAPLSPIHPAVLAVAALFAVLYGAYEYRGDLANKIHQFRANRAARRASRRGTAGRGGD